MPPVVAARASELLGHAVLVGRPGSRAGPLRKKFLADVELMTPGSDFSTNAAAEVARYQGERS